MPIPFIEILRHFDNSLNTLIRDLSTSFNIISFAILVLISFLYGLIHSLGPGHGKSLVAAYFLKEKQPLKKSLLLAGVISLIHSGSAIVLSILFSFVLTGIKGMMQIKMQGYFMFASGLLICAIGLFFLITKIFFNKENEPEVVPKSKNLFLVGFSAGIVPCPAALMIMLITIAKGAPLIGLTAVIAISLGMFTILTIIGTVSITIRNKIISASGTISGRVQLISTIVEYLSISLIILIGAAMMLTILR